MVQTSPNQVNFGLFFQRGVNINVNQWSRRILYGTIAISSICICAMYSAFLVNFMTSRLQWGPYPSERSTFTAGIYILILYLFL